MTTPPTGQTQTEVIPWLEGQTQAQQQPEKILCCRECQNQVTRPRYAISVAGRHEHTFRNPAGYSFHVLCFSQAEGSLRAGEPTAEASWFADTCWCFALCARCHAHLGWWYSGPTGSFVGLIATRLIR